MTNIIESARKICETTQALEAQLEHYVDRNTQIDKLETLVLRILPLFQQNVVLLHRGQSLEGLAKGYASSYPALAPFIIQLFPDLNVPQELQDRLSSESGELFNICKAQAEINKIKSVYSWGRLGYYISNVFRDEASEGFFCGLNRIATLLCTEGYSFSQTNSCPQAQEQIQICAYRYPHIFPFLLQLNRHALVPFPEYIDTELQRWGGLPSKIAGICQKLPGTKEATDLLLDRIDRVLKEEEKSKAYHWLIKDFREKQCLSLLENYATCERNGRVALRAALLIEILHVLSSGNKWQSFDFKRKYSIKEEALLLEMAKISAAENPRDTCLFLEQFGLSQSALVELAKHMAKIKGEILSEHIQKFGIEEEKERFEIAKIAFENKESVIFHFKNYQITERFLRFELAKIAAVNRGDIARYIGLFEIESEDERAEVAMLSAAQNGWSDAMCFTNYNIANAEARTRIAKMAALHSERGHLTWGLSSYQIQDKEQLIGIIKIVIQKQPSVSVFIQHCGLDPKDEKLWMELAELAARSGPFDFLCYIRNYNIKNRQVLMRLLEIAVAQDASAVSSNICKFRNLLRALGEEMTEEECASLALTCAAEDAKGVSKHMQDYGIASEETRTRIAEAAAAQDAEAVLEHIANYAIGGEEFYVRLAELAVAKSDRAVDLILRDKIIQDSEKLFGIFLVALANRSATDGRAISKLSMIFRQLSLKSGFPDFEAIIGSFDDDFGWYRSVIPKIKSLCEKRGWGNFWSLVEPEILKIKIEDIDNRKILLAWLIHFLGSCALHKISVNELDFLGKYFIKACMRHTFTKEMMCMAKKGAAQWYAMMLFPQPPEPPRKSPPPPRPHTVLPLLLLSSIFTQDTDFFWPAYSETCEAHFKAVSCDAFKDGKKLRIYINFLNAVLKAKELNTEEKNDLLRRVLEERQQLISCMQIVTTLMASEGASKLKGKELSMSFLSTLLQENFKKTVPIKPVENFAERFLEKILHTRVPNFALIYAAKIKSSIHKALSRTEVESVLRFLGSCIDAVLDGSFKEKRYDTSTNLHLKTVFAQKPHLLKLWAEGSKADLISHSVPSDSKRIDFGKEFHQKINKDKHVSPDRLTFLSKCVQTNSPSTTVLQEIEQQLQTMALEDEKFHLLSVEHKCIQLLESALVASTQIALLTQILEHLHHVQGAELFINDIQAMKDGLQKNYRNFDGYTLVDTDDFEDLFLCGTEVGGSCQSIDGNPYHSKCLMAYVFDGKNRLLAVKDAQGKIIARQILRVLWDGEEPVLFLDTLYPSVTAEGIQETLLSLAKEKARKMGLKLVSEESTKICYKKDIWSLGSPAPFEYFDSSGGVFSGERQVCIRDVYLI